MSLSIDEIISNIYEVSSLGGDYKNKTTFNENTVGHSIYGEITQTGTNALVNHFKEYFNEDSVFYDLCSGLGKMVLHIGLQYKIKKCVGIEYSKERHAGAIFLQQKYAPNNSTIQLKKENFLHSDFSDATIIYLDNTVVPTPLLKKIYPLIPPGCLFIYKKRIRSYEIKIKEEQHLEKNLVKRTYNQNDIRWLIKE